LKQTTLETPQVDTHGIGTAVVVLFVRKCEALGLYGDELYSEILRTVSSLTRG